MQMQKTLYFIIILLTTLGITGCERDLQLDNQSLTGTWKCLGFGDTNTWDFKEIDNKGCSQCFLLNFNEDNTMRGVTMANTLEGEFEISSNNGFRFINVGSTKVYEEGDAIHFAEALSKVNTYEARGEQLLLYYTNNQYLLFEQED